MEKCCKFVLLCFYFIVNIHRSLQIPGELEDQKAAYKSGELPTNSVPITLDTIKQKLKDSGIFDWYEPTLTDREKKELNKLFEAVEIMTTSRARQPSNIQNVFSSLRIVERAVKKQVKEGQISESLAAKFHWDKIKSNRRGDQAHQSLYHSSEGKPSGEPKMRVFNY